QVMPLIILIVIWIVIVMTFGVWKIIAVTLARPLILVMQDSRKIAQNQFDTPEIYVENEDEIGELVQAFNKMKKAMKRYIHTLEEKNKIAELLYAEEMEKMELEKNLEHTQLEVLKHQVNPHFLFNTLNMISSMARLEDADVTSKMIISLGNLFRYNLRTIEQEVYLEQEIEVLEDYIYIQQMRFDSRICYEKKINVDEKIVKIPSFTLQPIVENAFVHGVLSKESGGKIMLKVWQKEDKVVIVIADNGKGMEKEKLCALNQTIHQKNTSGYGIGLGNICRRINILYTNGSFKIFSKKDMGTIIRMEIPQGERKEEIKDVSLVSSR
ncbi:MAG: histidine kinase, partial [Lachnospiraceae bacterium]|nr:histidine kinase [Lachnospiraceae bacterium]